MAAAAAAATTGGATDDGAPSSEGAAEVKAEGETKARTAKGRAKWKAQIADGRPVTIEEVEAGQLGAIPLSEYLLAMGENVGRDGRQADILRPRVKDALKERKVRRWSVGGGQ